MSLTRLWSRGPRSRPLLVATFELRRRETPTLSLPPQDVPRERVRRRSLSRLLRHMLLYTADADAP